MGVMAHSRMCIRLFCGVGPGFHDCSSKAAKQIASPCNRPPIVGGLGWRVGLSNRRLRWHYFRQPREAVLLGRADEVFEPALLAAVHESGFHELDGARSLQRSAIGWFVRDGERARCFFCGAKMSLLARFSRADRAVARRFPGVFRPRLRCGGEAVRDPQRRFATVN